MRHFPLFGLLALLAPTGPLLAQAAECDALAGFAGNQRAAGAATAYGITDPRAAVDACTAALAEAPDDATLALRLARARLALNNDDPEALVLLLDARNGQRALADWMIGQLYEYGLAGLPFSERQARDVYTAVCSHFWPAPEGAPACSSLAVMRIEGRGGPVDQTGGFNLLRNLCNGGWGPACTEAAFQTELRGDGDPARIAALFEAGCTAGDLLACSQFGFRLELGEGVARDIQRAAALYRRACDGGEGQGCSNLGEIYRSGLGVRPDMDQAIRLFELGCAGHDSYACVTLGDIFEGGRGVARDLGRALVLFEAACTLGDPEGCDRADALD